MRRRTVNQALKSSPGRRGGSEADGGGSPSTRRRTVDQARHLRRTMSLPEVLLWQRLKGSPQGVSFRKQHPIDPYIVDFYCAAARLVIEVDGEVHVMGDRPGRDEVREQILRGAGYRMVRIAAKDILADADGVADGILALAAPPLHHASLVPLPASGEEF